jgi:hypothetical protein
MYAKAKAAFTPSPVRSHMKMRSAARVPMPRDDECDGRHPPKSRSHAAPLTRTRAPEPNSTSTPLVLVVRLNLCWTIAEVMLFAPVPINR